MGTLLTLLILSCFCSLTVSSTWFIRADGGNRTQCSGTADKAYDGTTKSSDCAFGDWRLLYDTNEYLDHTYNNLSWVIKGGDTVIVDNTKQWRVGWDHNNNANEPWCWGWSGGPYGCLNPAIPEGTAEQPTRILGRNWNNTCYTGTGVYKVPDRTKTSQLFGGHGVGTVLNLGGAKHVEVQCLEITSHNSGCANAGYPEYPRGCVHDFTQPQGMDDYASSGISTDSNSDQILIQNVDIHGLGDAGIIGPMWGYLRADTVRIGYVQQTGWNFDDGYQTPNIAPSGIPGTVNATNFRVEFSGCLEEYPITHKYPALMCYSQGHGGVCGDGVGTASNSRMNWYCDQCTSMFNTQDAYDLGHNSGAQVVFTNSIAYANMGGTYKSGGQQYFEVSNSIAIANCARMLEPLDGAPDNYSMYCSDFCRAGDQLSFNALQINGTVTEMIVRDNTIVGTAPCVADVQCWAGGCVDYDFVWENNIVLSFSDQQWNEDIKPGMWNVISATNQNHNLIYGLHGCPYLNTTDICLVAQAETVFNNQVSFLDISTEAQFDQFTDFSLAAGGTATHTGRSIASVTTDFAGRPRNPTNTSRGALEFGSAFTFPGGDINYRLPTPPPSITSTASATSTSAKATGSTSAKATGSTSAKATGSTTSKVTVSLTNSFANSATMFWSAQVVILAMFAGLLSL